MYEYKCKILKIVDGDTVDIDIDLGFGIWMHKERVRIMGIDTPESRTRDLVEKQFGLAAKEYLRNLLPISSIQHLKTQIDRNGGDKKGKFGRILGDFILDDKLVTELMIDNHHAVAYNGQNKEDVAEAHLTNRAILIENGSIKIKE